MRQVRIRRIIIVHKSHKYLLRILLIDKYISLHELNAPIVKGNFDLEVVAEILEQFLSINVRIKRVSSTCEDQDRPKEVDHNCVHNWISSDGLLHRDVALTENSKELHDEVLELQIAED
jgi:hypothetical protein